MTTTGVDRIAGLSGSVAMKAPCQYRTTAPITLSGLGVQAGGTWGSTLTQDDSNPTRVLVMNQTNPVDNGVWNPGAGTWQRARDFNGSRDVVQGTLVHVYQDATDLFYELTTANPVIGTSSLAFAGVDSVALTNILAVLASTSVATDGAGRLGFNGALNYSAQGDDTVGGMLYTAFGRTAKEITAGVTPTNYAYAPGDVRRYGCVCDATDSSDGTDDTLAWVEAVKVANAGQPIFIPAGLMSLFRGHVASGNYTLALTSGARVYGPGAIKYNPIAAGFVGVFHTGNIFSEVNAARSDIIIDGVKFLSKVDQQYLHFIGIFNRGGDLTDITVQNCVFRYEAATHTGSDRWAIIFGGSVGTTRRRINVLRNKLFGKMQLTAGGQGANWEDLNIEYNTIVGGYVAAIALTRLETGAANNYKRISIRHNGIYMTEGTLGVYLGPDTDSASPEGENWEDVGVEHNYIMISTGGSTSGVFFRRPQTGSLTRISVSRNTIYADTAVNLSSHNSSIVTPTLVAVKDNVCPRGDMATSWNCKFEHNDLENDIRQTDTVTIELVNNRLRGLRLESTSTALSSGNTYRMASNGSRGINVNAPAANTVTLTSVNDTFSATTGVTPQCGIRLSGAGTVTATIIHPHDTVRSSWQDDLLRSEDSKVPTYYEPDTLAGRVPFTAAAIASAANVVNTSIMHKFPGSLIWDSTNNRMMRADGANPTSIWRVVDGSASVTPA